MFVHIQVRPLPWRGVGSFPLISFSCQTSFEWVWERRSNGINHIFFHQGRQKLENSLFSQTQEWVYLIQPQIVGLSRVHGAARKTNSFLCRNYHVKLTDLGYTGGQIRLSLSKILLPETSFQCPSGCNPR